MSLAIAGMGWVTPLGNGVDAVWERLLHGDEASATAISEQLRDRSYYAFRVPESALTGLAHPRLRRASLISRFAASAGLEALQAAGVKMDSQNAGRIALIFAVSNGGVIYTRRFYRDVVESGAQSASPLLFPETVFNAPASHLAAILGVTGTTYTVVGDGAVGLLAIKMAEDVMTDQSLDYCLVVGTEEIDWLLCDAYRRWRLLRSEPPIEPFSKRKRGMILSEGAGAIVLARLSRRSAAEGRGGSITIERAHPGGCYRRRTEAKEILMRIVRDLSEIEPDFVVSSANGTFIDHAEQGALEQVIPNAITYAPKPALGESVGASGLWQVILGIQALRHGELPPVLHVDPNTSLRLSRSRTSVQGAREAIILSSGVNQQVAGLRLALS
ncbi:MAG TPA: beta-ketoacyl synthase N-terminal-like domain-containing protein [Candidatus Udaeobacter sp.]|nr:beta-ketoacyl synthase N-terminal-like domain-containing protein [Candidatus Udaeobacter sp.]